MDPYQLSRFTDAQRHTFHHALSELQCGEKSSHWMWFIFPQLRHLGHSDRAVYYGISGLEEARAYIRDPVLRDRLIQVSQTILAHREKTAVDIFGHTDAKKLRSCMTLFREAAPQIPVFDEVLTVFYDGKPDKHTLNILRNGN